MDSSNKIKIESWYPLAIWTFQSVDDTCSICREHLTHTCATCLNNSTLMNDFLNCKVSKGKCGHSYHKHCIEKWGLKSQICPICTLPWAIETDDMSLRTQVQGLVSKK